MPYKIRRLIKGKGGARLGGISDYADFSTIGRLTAAGSARFYKDMWLPAAAWYGIEPNQFANAFLATATAATCTPIVQPAEIYGGKATASPMKVPVLAASVGENLDARVTTVFLAPPDAASTGSVQCHLYYTTRLEFATTGSMEVWRVHYAYLGSAGSAPGSGVSGSIVYGASMATTGSGKLEIQNIGNLPSFRTASPFVALQLTLENSNASAAAGSPEEHIYGMRLRYVAETLGANV
jgi:hypothetical protein